MLRVTKETPNSVSIFTPDGDLRAGRLWAYTVTAAVLLFVVLPISLWAFGVFTSGIRGAGDVTKQHNSGSNQVAQNTTLLGANATVLADEAKIRQMAGAQSTTQEQMALQGAEQVCDSDVQAYNADVQNILASGYLPAGLPSSYPLTVCEAPAA